MKKISTAAIEGIQIFKDNQLTIGVDLGDRTSHYCILDEARQVILEQELPTTPKGFEPAFSKIPRSRIAHIMCYRQCKIIRLDKLAGKSHASATFEGYPAVSSHFLAQ